MGTNLIIRKADGSLVPIQNRRTATRVTSGKQNWALNAEDTLNITVESPFPQKYSIGDVITVFGRDYKLNRLPKVKRTGMHEFSYDLEFEGIQYDLLRVTYDLTIDTTNNQLQDVQGDSLTGDLRRFMVVLIANANRVFPGKWVLGSCPETIGDKTLTFGESDNCLSVLQNLCGASNFNVEFEIETANGIHTINLKERVGQTLPYTFMYGKGNGLYALNRDNVSSSNIVTRLKVYGSTENITMKYRADRLCLPGKNKAQSYIEKLEAVAKYGVFEARKNFDNIKPTYTGVVSAIVAGNVLQFKDKDFPFDLNAKEADGVTTKYLIVGVDAKIHFNTGNLAGYDFTVNKYDHATRTFTLNKLTDDRGDVFPSETSVAFQFGVGDEYKITDIAYSEDIEQAAENKLAEEANKYYDQNSQPKVQYGLTVTKEWLKSLVDATDDKIVNVFAPGDYLHVVDDDIDVDKSVRIKSFTRNILDPYDYTLTISDITTNTQIINRVISDLVDIDKVLNINNLKDPTRARANWRSSREVLDMVFDPEGDYYTDKIKPNSIDTLALSVGAKSMQFGLTNTVFQPNYNGNKNVVKWQGGVLTHYTINEETAVSWVLADGQMTLSKDSDAYYIYAKCARNGQAGTIVFTKEQHKVNEDANYYYFWIGVLNSVDVELKARSIALTYGFTMVNGRFIKTGRIESADGKTYFDLDNSEIGGRIVFNSNGEEKTLEQLGQDAIDAAIAASRAQVTADGKRRVFVSTPRAPYDVGDLWASGTFLKRCIVARAAGDIIIYQASDWDLATNYTGDENLNAFIDGVFGDTISDIYNQLDGKVELWYTTTDPASNWTTDEEKAKHVGDQWFNTSSNRLYHYTKSNGNYIWEEIKNQDAIDAAIAASRAQDTADGKRRVFVATPTTPYDIGDLWVNGSILRRCATAKTATQSYNVNDWVVAVDYDNTKTVIDGGLVTSGTIQVAGDNASILAGITGKGTTDDAIRFWAGASFENRATAPFRVQQNGKAIATNLHISEESTFAGELKGASGSFYGIVKISLLYNAVKNLSQATYYVDPENEPFNWFVYNNPTIDTRLYLPDANKYDGMEISVFIVYTGSQWSVATYNYVSPTNGNKLLCMQNIYNHNLSTTDFATMRKYNAPYKGNTSGWRILFNTLYRFKAMGGHWYAIDGIFTGE